MSDYKETIEDLTEHAANLIAAGGIDPGLPETGELMRDAITALRDQQARITALETENECLDKSCKAITAKIEQYDKALYYIGETDKFYTDDEWQDCINIREFARTELEQIRGLK